MKIGFFKMDNQSDELVGKIVTRTLRFPYLIMRPVVEIRSESTPKFEIFEPNSMGEEVQIGAVWSNKMNKRDEDFLAGMIDDPSFPEKLPIALFGDELNGFDVNWRRERDPQSFSSSSYGGGNAYGGNGGGFSQPRRTGGQRQNGGGFAGGSTASANGEYVGAGRGLDDEVPF